MPGLLFNPLTTNLPHHIETSQLNCNANQLTGLAWGRMAVNGLRDWSNSFLSIHNEWDSLLNQNVMNLV